MDMNGFEIYVIVFVLVFFYYDINIIWVGFDDGKIYIIWNGGKKWDDIIFDDLFKFLRVSIIDELRYWFGILYIVVNRY